MVSGRRKPKTGRRHKSVFAVPPSLPLLSFSISDKRCQHTLSNKEEEEEGGGGGGGEAGGGAGGRKLVVVVHAGTNDKPFLFNFNFREHKRGSTLECFTSIKM